MTLGGDISVILGTLRASTFNDRLEARGRAALKYSSESELRKLCVWLAGERVAFTIGGTAGWGPAEIMREWQKEGVVSVTFLEISWKGPEEWLFYEIPPEPQSEWDKVSLDEILAT